MRARLDNGDAGFLEVADGTEPLRDLLERRVSEEFEQIVAIASDSRLRGTVVTRLEALEASLAAFEEVDALSTTGSQVFVGSVVLPELLTTDAVRELIASKARFDAAVDAAVAFDDVPAADAWRRLLDDPAAQRTESGYDSAIALGLGTTDQADLSQEILATSFADAVRWSTLLNDAVRTASADLREEARDQARAETVAMIWRLAATAIVAVVALAVAVRISRGVALPMERISAAAARVRAGELDPGRVEPGGPREVASTAAAFNDMTTTLREIERRAIALAETPDDPALAEPLPGRMGQALQGALNRLLVSIRLAEERRAELQLVATHDGLTGLLNRTAALDAIGRELAQARRDDDLRFAFFIDLDNLKPINDTHGHDAGDDAIRLTAEAIRSETRDADVVSRLGGDEFLVAGRTSGGRDEIEDQARRIVAAVGSQVVRIVGGEIPLRCSLGIATTEPDAEGWSVDELVQAADDALYDAKRAGGNTVRWAAPAPGSAP